MAYRIDYSPLGKARKEKRQNKNQGIIIAVAFILTAGILHITGVTDSVRDFLIPGDTEVTTAAWNQMMDVLRNGGSFGQAAVVFCELVLEGSVVNG